MRLFEFISVPRIIFGNGTIHQIGQLAGQIGKNILVVSGKSKDRPGILTNLLESHGLKASVFPISGEPAVEDIRAGVSFAREIECELVIGFGGGSALDASKAIAILLQNEGDIYDYLEVIGKGRVLANQGLPLITIPTTAGTGAEVTRNAVIAASDRQVKVSLRSPFMQARIALVDPELTWSNPPEVTARSGMDTLSQLVEPFLSNQANWMTDMVCREGMQRVRHTLLQAYQSGDDPLAREEMAFASLLSGLALANAKLGVVHGFASVIGGLYPAPHGTVCARLLPAALEVNLKAITERGEDSKSIEKFTEIARILTGKEDAQPQDGIAWIGELVRKLQIPPLSAFGLEESHFSSVVEMAMLASSTRGNPIVLTESEMTDILASVV